MEMSKELYHMIKNIQKVTGFLGPTGTPTPVSEKEIIEFFKAISHVARMLKVSSVEGGYRALSNIGKNGGQEVPHLHFHIFGGENVGKMVSS